MTSIELLSPAQNLECGMAAVDHGADAVYIGSPRYGARAAAGNSVDDIARLCSYAHPFGVRIYVTLNTILYDAELQDTERLVHALYQAGVDALIVQDLSLLQMNLPPIALHASTQMDNRTPKRVRLLRDLGFRQTVLARELSLAEIGEIHRQVPDMPLEAFVHGALCVSYSGQCYASQYCFGRSANRGECAQFCRLPFTLTDATGRALTPERHLLSLRDMNRLAYLEEMMDAGVRSFKIEGRLKDVSYVKNVTAAYRRAIDRVLQHRQADYCRSSFGHSECTFTPDPRRSFSRGFTDYFLHGKRDELASMDTPKSRGVEVGRVREVSRDSIVVAGTTAFANGDGLCFLDADGRLCGFRVNRAQGNRLFPSVMPRVRRGDVLWRNYDQAWERLMAGPTARRTVDVAMHFCDVPDGFRLTITREDGRRADFLHTCEHQLARTPQDDVVRQTLAKTGDTIYRVAQVDVHLSQPWFVPRSLLAQWRRDDLASAFGDSSAPLNVAPASSTSASALSHSVDEASSSLASLRASQEHEAFFSLASLRASQEHEASSAPREAHVSVDGQPRCTYLANVSNHLARRSYEQMGFKVDEMAMECGRQEGRDYVLMTCRYCLKHALGWCARRGGKPVQATEPLYLNLSDGRRFRLEFDCRRCEMMVHNA